MKITDTGTGRGQFHRKITWAWHLLITVFLQAGTSLLADTGSTNTPAEITYQLTRPVPYVAQSTNGTCWLACAAMVWGYYGQSIDEKSLDEKVRQITGSDRGGQLKATKRECMIALAQNGGLEEEFVQQYARLKQQIKNEGKAIGNGLEQFTNVPNQLFSTNFQPVPPGQLAPVMVFPTTATTGNKTATKTGFHFSSIFHKSTVTPAPPIANTVANTGTNHSTNEPIQAGVQVNAWGLLTHQLEKLTRAPDLDLVVTALKNQEPVVIVCRLGRWTKEEHAMVVTAVTLSAPPAGKPGAKPEVFSVEVLDPAAETNKPVAKPEEYLKANLRAVYTKSTAEKDLENERNDLKITL